MISNERSHNSGYRDGPPPPQKPAVEEKTIRTERIQIERKSFTFILKENPRGRFLRITEDVSGRRDTIIIPAPGLEEFRRVLDEIASTSAETPPVA